MPGNLGSSQIWFNAFAVELRLSQETKVNWIKLMYVGQGSQESASQQGQGHEDKAEVERQKGSEDQAKGEQVTLRKTVNISGPG